MLGLNTTCDIYRAVRTVNDYGEEIPTWSRTDHGAKCRVVMGDYARREALQVAGGADARVATHMVVLPADIDVAPGDRILWQGRYYDVLSADDVDGIGHHLECHVVRLEGTDA